VLDFSDSSFSEFFAAELDVDIDDPIYAEHGGSKGKRLRCFLQKVDDGRDVRPQRLVAVRYMKSTRHSPPPLLPPRLRETSG
jgi:hypothetical protein